LLIYDCSSGDTHCLSSPAALVIDALSEQPMSPEAIAASCTAMGDVDAAAILATTMALLEAMVELGLAVTTASVHASR